MKKIISILSLAAIAMLIGGNSLLAQNDMSKEEAAAMEKAWANAMTPGEQQEFLSQMAGDFVYTQTNWMYPGAEPIVSQGKAINSMVLGGRYLRETYNGSNMGMSFQGEGILSHNNIDGKWYMSWIDNMGTGVMSGVGERKGNTVEFQCEYPKIDGSGMDHFRIVHDIPGKDSHTMQMFQLDDASGEYHKWMEVVFTRK